MRIGTAAFTVVISNLMSLTVAVTVAVSPTSGSLLDIRSRTWTCDMSCDVASDMEAVPLDVAVKFVRATVSVQLLPPFSV